MAVQVKIDGCDGLGREGDSLFDCAERVKVRVPTSCQKRGKCRECLVEVTTGMDCLGPREPEEDHLQGAFRLSCRARIQAESGEVVCSTLRRGSMKIETGATGIPGGGIEVPLDPAVTRRDGGVYLDGRPIADSGGALHGLAVDLGTTTVVVRLVDLETGTVVATRSFENPQRFGGSDVLARISFDGRHPGRLLRRTLLGYLRHAVEALPADPRSIYEVLVAGNTTMRDLFFGLDIQGIGQKPYRSRTEEEFLAGLRTTTALTAPARRFGLPLHPEARVVSLPLVASHVGADTTAGLLAIGFQDIQGTVALMDIGTNTELVLRGPGRCLTASCPAGPAFEGGALTCGMPALEGAVETFRFGDGDRFEMGVIGEGPPQGICGSGLIDLLGELRRTERLDRTGRFKDGAGQISLGEGVMLAEPDIEALAQAKAANAAGLAVLFDRFGIDFDDLDVLYLAGGFAGAIDLDQARRIGLIPPVPDDRIVQVGNACIAGATRALLSVRAREQAEALVRTIEHVSLETHPGFFDAFVDGCQFQPVVSLRGDDVAGAVQVDQAELARLLQWPSGRPFDGYLEEAIRDARTWYDRSGHPWTHHRTLAVASLEQDAVVLEEGTRLRNARLSRRLEQAGAHRMVVIGVSAGPAVDARIRDLWSDAPDQAMVLNAYAAGVAEQLLRSTIQSVCAAVGPAEQAVLPHDSPGYEDWDLRDQNQVYALLADGKPNALPLTVNEQGMLTPLKSMLAVVGLTRRAVAPLDPSSTSCRYCSLAPCSMRREPYSPAAAPGVPHVPSALAVDHSPSLSPPLGDPYTVSVRTLARWAEENLRLQPRGNGDLAAVFSFQGSSCRNEPFELLYELVLRPEADGYRIRSAACRPAPGSPGLEVTCAHRRADDELHAALGARHPVAGQRLVAVFEWRPATNPAGCLCTEASRNHKWRLVFQTVHYKLTGTEEGG